MSIRPVKPNLFGQQAGSRSPHDLGTDVWRIGDDQIVCAGMPFAKQILLVVVTELLKHEIEEVAAFETKPDVREASLDSRHGDVQKFGIGLESAGLDGQAPSA